MVRTFTSESDKEREFFIVRDREEAKLRWTKDLMLIWGCIIVGFFAVNAIHDMAITGWFFRSLGTTLLLAGSFAALILWFAWKIRWIAKGPTRSRSS
jgi:hypothetical protein